MKNQEIENGIKASEEYQALSDRFEGIRAGIISQWEESATDEADLREWLYSKLLVLKELEQSFLNDIQTGQMAERAENAKRKRTE